jgi:hypothetical protein
MPPIDFLGKTKARLLTCGALMAGGTLVSAAIAASNPITGTALLSGTLAMAGSVAGGIFANDLGDLAKGLGENEEILNDRELTQAVGLAIALVIYSVAKDKQYSAHKAALERVAKKSVSYWQSIAAATEGDKDYAGVHEAQLPEIFSTNPTDFSKVRALDIATWKHAFGWLSGVAGVRLPEDAIAHVAEKLHTTFPKALREVLKHDASKGGQAFSGMLLLLLGNITATLKPLNTQSEEIVKRLKGVATTQQVCQVMARVESGIRTDLAEIKRVLERIAVSQVRQLPVPDDFRWIIEDKTKGFVGREFVFDAIEDFFQQQRKGYFIIEGDPGMGKSSILAEFVRRNDCIVYFNQRNEGITSAEQFLRSVCIQLIEGYGLSHSKDIQPENTRNSNFLSQLLNEVSGTLKSGERLVIAVDALDEVDLSSQSKGANVLYLPQILPENVFFVLTKRLLQLPLRVNDQKRFNLMRYEAENQQDAQDYIGQCICKSQPLQRWIHRQSLKDEEFVMTLAAKSESNFEYLRHVLPAIEKGDYQDLNIENLPQGLENYYEDHWERMGMNADPLPEVKIKIVYLLATALEPVSRGWIVRRLDTQNPIPVVQILKEWDQFLREQQVDNETRYSLYHSSFRDFLYRQDIVQAAGETIEGVNARIVDSLTKGLFDDE